MPPLVRRFLKTAIAFLAAGLVSGLWLLAARELGLGLPPRARSAHTHLLLVGFVMMMIAGVALWMFPRPAKDDPRYRPERAGWAYWCLTVGTAVRGILELTLEARPARLAQVGLLAAAVLQVVGLLLVFWMMIPRIRSTLPPRES